MIKSSRWNFLLVLGAALAVSQSPALAQLKTEPVDATAPEPVLVISEETAAVAAPAPLIVETTFYIPEPSTYGLLGAASLGLLLAARRIMTRSTALVS